jgi:hypothetical protein
LRYTTQGEDRLCGLGGARQKVLENFNNQMDKTDEGAISMRAEFDALVLVLVLAVDPDQQNHPPSPLITINTTSSQRRYCWLAEIIDL